MKNIRTLITTLTLALLLTGSAVAGETQTPPAPCIPGETQTPPCMSVTVEDDSTTTGETQTLSQSVDLVSLGELALDLLLY